MHRKGITAEFPSIQSVGTGKSSHTSSHCYYPLELIRQGAQKELVGTYGCRQTDYQEVIKMVKDILGLLPKVK